MKSVPSNAQGFSLIELVVTIGIIALLAAIAVPSYTSYVQQSRRTDAIRALATARQVLERCYTQYYAYNNLNCPGLAPNSPNGYYAITTPTLTANTYLLQAAAQGVQLKDQGCTAFRIDQTGAQTSTGTSTAQICWGSN
jgi:type IV pilus assembly protein PilE